MKILGLLACVLIFCGAQTFAQAPSAPKDWTAWAPVEGNWAEFYVMTNFHGGNRTPEELARKELKSLKVDCLILGRLLGQLPDDLRGAKTFKVLYTEYGKFRTTGDFSEDSLAVQYAGREQYLQPVQITRPASQFDVAEASKPLDVIEMNTTMPTLLVALGVSDQKGRITGHKHRAALEWRRKGSTVELRVKDYRPAS